MLGYKGPFRLRFAAVTMGILSLWAAAIYAFVFIVSHPTRTVTSVQVRAFKPGTVAQVAAALGKPAGSADCKQLGLQLDATCTVWQKHDGYIITATK